MVIILTLSNSDIFDEVNITDHEPTLVTSNNLYKSNKNEYKLIHFRNFSPANKKNLVNCVNI